MRVAVVGYGLAGAVFHAPLVAATPGLGVAAIVTNDPERARRARRAHPDATVVRSVDDLWELGIDIAVVATPNRFHAPIALAALDHGCFVVVDKPLAVSAAEAETLLARADRRLTVFHNRRWDGDFLTVRRLVDAGTFGDVVRFESRFERYRPQIKPGWREESDPAGAGGTLFDLGPHLVDQALVLFGAPTSVFAEVAARRPAARVDDDAFLALEHPGGVWSHLWMSAVAPVPGPRFVVGGLYGGFSSAGLDPQEDQLRHGVSPDHPSFGRSDVAGTLVGVDGTARSIELDRGRYRDFYAGVHRWATRSGPPPVDPADAVEGLRILEAARRSAETGTVTVMI